MGKIYRGTSGVQYQIEEQRLAGGGEGSVFGIQGQPQFVAKIYKENRRTSEREQKLCHMIQYRLTPDQLKQITWPQDVLYDENGFAGYVMPRLDKTDSLVSIYSNGFDNKYDIRYRVLAAINLCVALKTVHEMGQVCGDLNPQNICINLDTTDAVNGFHVTLVDTDSYHFTADGKTYRCEVGLGDYIAPELQNKMAQGYDLKNVPLPSYTKESDLFALAVQCFVVYLGLLKVFSGLNPFIFIKKFFPVMAFAFSTSTSNATIPMNIDTLAEKLGVSKKISSFTIPLGATINMDGTSIMQGVAVVFTAQAFGIPLDMMDYLTVIGTATLASIGTAGVPSVGLITLTMVFNSVGLPVEGIALIMGIDRILDMTRTAVNITGDAVCTTIVASWDKAVKKDVYYDKNR